MKNKLIYSKNGIAYPDYQADVVAKTLKELSVTTSTENVIHAFRLLIQEKYFVHDEVEVFFERIPGEFLPVVFNKNGRTTDWYVGFCDTYDKVLQGLLECDLSPPTHMSTHSGFPYPRR